MRPDIQPGQTVVDALGRDTGEVADIVLGRSSHATRFFTIREGMFLPRRHLVPYEAIEHVGGDGRLHLRLNREQVQMLPAYDGEAPTADQARHAYEMLGGAPEERGYRFGMVPFADTQRRPAEPREYVVDVEQYVVWMPERQP